MNATRWAAIGVVAFVAIIVVASLLIGFSADAFDRTPATPGVWLTGDDFNSPSRVHWVVGEPRTFKTILSDTPGSVMAAGGNAVRVVLEDHDGSDPCGDTAEELEVFDGREVMVYPCTAGETALRVYDANSGLTLGAYRFEVHAAGTVAPGPTPAALARPDRVAGVVAERVSDGAISLHWEVPGDWGGLRFGYQVRRREQGSGWNATYTKDDPLDTRILDTDRVAPGVAYEYQVRALGSISHGGWSEIAAASLETPDPPTAVVVSEDASTDASDLSVTWSAPVAGVTPTQYGIERSVEHGPWVTIHLSVASSAVRYVENAAPGAHYCYRVWSGNDHGTSVREPLGGACISVPFPTPTPVPEPTPEGE